MKFNIVSKEKNQALHRDELKFEISDAKITPSVKELREKIAALNNTKTELVIIDRITHKFGSKDVIGEAKVYENANVLNEIEPKHRINKNLGIKEKKEKKKEEKAPYKPVKEEAKKEDEEAKETEEKAKPEEKPVKEEKTSKEQKTD